MNGIRVPSRVLVTGASGTTGRRLVRLLLERGVAVRQASRSGSDVGAERVRFDWYDSSTHHAALEGVEAAYLLPPSADPAPESVMVPFLETARSAGVRRVVLLSNALVGAGDAGTGIVHEAVAARFDEWAVLRPNWFMQDFVGEHPFAVRVRSDASIASDTGDARVGFVDADDIARVAAEALLAKQPLNSDPVLTGPEAISLDDVAAEIGAASGFPITHDRVPRAQLPGLYASAGVPAGAAAFMAVMDAAIARGAADTTTDAVERITGTPARSFHTFASAAFGPGARGRGPGG